MKLRLKVLLGTLVVVSTVWAVQVFAAPMMEEMLFNEVCQALSDKYPDKVKCAFIPRPEVIYTRLVGMLGPYAGVYIRGEARIFIQWPPSPSMKILRTVQHEFAHYIIVTQGLLPSSATVCEHEELVRTTIGQEWGEREKGMYGCGADQSRMIGQPGRL
jgi:hypothetical protein